MAENTEKKENTTSLTFVTDWGIGTFSNDRIIFSFKFGDEVKNYVVSEGSASMWFMNVINSRIEKYKKMEAQKQGGFNR